jgi:hypothetical protein
MAPKLELDVVDITNPGGHNFILGHCRCLIDMAAGHRAGHRCRGSPWTAPSKPTGTRTKIAAFCMMKS